MPRNLEMPTMEAEPTQRIKDKLGEIAQKIEELEEPLIEPTNLQLDLQQIEEELPNLKEKLNPTEIEDIAAELEKTTRRLIARMNELLIKKNIDEARAKGVTYIEATWYNKHGSKNKIDYRTIKIPTAYNLEQMAINFRAQLLSSDIQERLQIHPEEATLNFEAALDKICEEIINNLPITTRRLKELIDELNQEEDGGLSIDKAREYHSAVFKTKEAINKIEAAMSSPRLSEQKNLEEEKNQLRTLGDRLYDLLEKKEAA
ncbi:MAG: hypothetical protein JW816_01730 [Candidatus Buchananbacteria bacterium]|nr:hypothetical protein [Candidatus Buchananbacteria bacterium]